MENCSPKSQAIGEFEDPAGTAFIERNCLPLLERAQNDDGGWGFAQGSLSRVEPTSWALLALQEYCLSGCGDRAAAGGLQFLQRTQLGDGSWPAAIGQKKGSWVTSLACWALRARPEACGSVARGLRWLTDEWPGDSGLWWRLMRRFARGKGIVDQNDSLCGWSWTPGTASWVEPTSYAVLAMRGSPSSLLPAKARLRLQLAESLLYERMCPGGGWNCGNPMVYGVPGEPQVGPTVWALLALRANSERPEMRQSVNWLEKNWETISSPARVALSAIALDVFGRPNPAAGTSLRNLCENDQMLRNVPVAAWIMLAMSKQRTWLKNHV
jgi:hypothetical protein